MSDRGPSGNARRAHTFRLHMLGLVASPEPLITLAEFGSQRALERVNFPAQWVESLTKQIAELRYFIEGLSGGYQRTALENLGSCLFDLIMRGTVRELLLRARGASPGALPFELVAEDETILGWPWEFMFDRGSGKSTFICQDFNPISRTVITPEALAPAPSPSKSLRVLVVIAVSPADRAAPDEQKKAISNAFETYLGEDRERVSIEYLANVEPDELNAELNAADFDVVHVFGHAGVDGRGGFLIFERTTTAGPERFEKRARAFARMLVTHSKPPRLVFLNACETAIGSPTEDTARSSVAIELMRYGLPAVIATQFKMPANRSHRFATQVYKAIANGRSLTQAMVDGRNAMEEAGDAGRFVDWGIPVLYAVDPHAALLRRPPMPAGQRRRLRTASRPVDLAALPGKGAAIAGQPQPAVKRVAVLDADADVGLFPEVIAAGNEVQQYFRFSISSYDLLSGDLVGAREALGGPIETPNGTVVPRINPDDPFAGPQLFVPRVAARLAQTPDEYQADYVCCLTRHRVATIDYDGTVLPNLFVTVADTEDLLGPGARYSVAVISVSGLRQHAEAAGVSMAKATLYLCAAALLDLANDELEFHKETRGCPLDACDDMAELETGLRRMAFDDPECITKVLPAQVPAINALLTIPDRYVPAAEPTDRWADPDLDRGIMMGDTQLVLNGVNAQTGRYAFPQVLISTLASRARQAPLAPDQLREVQQLAPKPGDVFLDVRRGGRPMPVDEGGWGIVFPASWGAGVIEDCKAALGPLLALRRNQAQGVHGDLFRVYSADKGYVAGETKLDWLQRNGAGAGLVDPSNVPYYLLLVGSPSDIPFDFQYTLALQYAVGRLYHDDLVNYTNYAASVAEAERRALTKRRAVFFGTRNPGDPATRLSATQLVAPLADAFERCCPGWQVERSVAQEATKLRLADLLNPAEPPAIIFTATHGLEVPASNPAQVRLQGALVCQEWICGQPPMTAQYVAATDILDGSNLSGCVIFQFGCFGGGTPASDELAELLDQAGTTVATVPFLARLPQRMLGLPRAPLAVVAHIDRAYGCSFIWPGVADYRNPFEDALRELAAGNPLGHALRGFAARYADLGATMGRGLGAREDDRKVVGWWTAWKDARNYVILGDPAVRVLVDGGG